MTSDKQTRHPFWLSWRHYPTMGAFILYWPWWESGLGPEDESTLCSAVIAADEAEAKMIVLQSYDNPPADLAWRFCNQRNPGWSPFSDRFPRAAWMAWPAPETARAYSEDRMSDKLKIMLFPAGTTAAFRNGEQVPELQESWFLLYVQLVAACGIDPCEVEFTMPDGGQATVFETEEGRYNWQRS